MKALRLISLAVLAVSLAGCGTVVRGFSQDVTFETTPPGATLTLASGKSCIAPCTLSLERVASVTVRASKPGCQDALRELSSNYSNHGTMLLTLADFQAGSAAGHRPGRVAINLTCNGKGPTVLMPYDDATMALLNGDQEQDSASLPFDKIAAEEQPNQLMP